MAFPPHAFAIHDGRVYSDWELHKLAAHGLRRYALVAALLSLFLVALDALLGRGSVEHAVLPAWVSRVSLFMATGVSVAFYALAMARKVEVQRPMALATLLSFAVAAAGALSAAAAGGFNGPLAFGLLPVVFAWPLVMPGGVKNALPSALGGLLLHFALVFVIAGRHITPEGRAVAGLLAFSVGAALAAAFVIEHWRTRAADLSQHDWLTNALSRPFLEERLTALCAQRQRSLAPVALVMFDIDRFKNINDSYGRQAGDEVLEMLVSGIKAEIRASDFIGRYGGDEFLLVLDECEGHSALALLDRLRARFSSKPMTVGDNQLKVSFAAGIVSVNPGDSMVMKELLRNAERALENSKEAGRNRTAMAPPPPPNEPPVAPGPISATDTQIVG
ncbi:MAG: GGDEF domain-containing protein [Myxococcaceae bacterium]|nr:GGDEF domain-containing protein [Myxococcaceae bacterium]